jgi:hypothetical protein
MVFQIKKLSKKFTELRQVEIDLISVPIKGSLELAVRKYLEQKIAVFLQ